MPQGALWLSARARDGGVTATSPHAQVAPVDLDVRVEFLAALAGMAAQCQSIVSDERARAKRTRAVVAMLSPAPLVPPTPWRGAGDATPAVGAPGVPPAGARNTAVDVPAAASVVTGDTPRGSVDAAVRGSAVSGIAGLDDGAGTAVAGL